jgi:hypothetical protein
VGGGLRRDKRFLTRALRRRSRDVRSRVRWLGTRRDLPSLFNATDFLLDTAPLSGSTIRIQAMAAGLPVVATRHASSPLMSWTSAFDDDYPLIATSGEEVVSYARELIAQPDLRERLGRRLLEHHAARFSPEVLQRSIDLLLHSDGDVAVPHATGAEYDLRQLAGLSGPVATGPALIRRARVWLRDPDVSLGERVLRKADQAAAVGRGLGRSRGS